MAWSLKSCFVSHVNQFCEGFQAFPLIPGDCVCLQILYIMTVMYILWSWTLCLWYSSMSFWLLLVMWIVAPVACSCDEGLVLIYEVQERKMGMLQLGNRRSSRRSSGQLLITVWDVILKSRRSAVTILHCRLTYIELLTVLALLCMGKLCEHHRNFTPFVLYSNVCVINILSHYYNSYTNIAHAT